MSRQSDDSQKRADDDSVRPLEFSASSAEWGRAVFEGSRDAVFLVDVDSSFLEVNSAAAVMTGYSTVELKRLSILDLYDPADVEEFHRQFESVMSGRSLTLQVAVKRKDGERIAAEVQARRIEIGGKPCMHATLRDVTRRKQVETQLLETAERFRLLAAATRDSVYDVDLQKGRVWRNEIYQRLFGAPREASIDESWWIDHVHPDDRDRVLQMERQNYASDSDGYVDEYRLRRDDGTYAHVVDRAFLLRDASGRAIRKIGAQTDITERKRVEEALRRSEERLEQAIEGAGLGLWDHDFKADKIVRSERWYEMLGYEQGEIEGGKAGWRTLVHPDDWPKAERIAAEHEAGLTPGFRVEHRMRAKSGEWRWILNWGRIVERDADGKPLRALGIHMDVTDFRRTEAALRDSEERYRAIFENAAEGIAIVDLETRVIKFANPSLCRMMGYSRDEIEGIDTFLLHPPFQHESLERVFTDALHNETMASVNSIPCTHRNGATIYASIYPTVVRINGRKCVIAFFTDITEKRAAAEEIARYREHLEELVDQRTTELEASRTRMRRAERLASIGTLAAGIAHEINNPLGMIMLGLEDIQASAPPSEDLKRILDHVKDDVKRCARIVKSVLRFARDETSEKWSESLNDIIRSSLDFTREYARRHNVALNERLAPRLPRVMANATEMEQVFVNLIHNAVNASESGGRVTLETRVVGDKVRAVVRDQGGGMTPEQMERAFDPFYTTRLEDGGTGLGLSTCHGIVTDHNGVISIQCREDSGVSVVVDLPMLAAEDVLEI